MTFYISLDFHDLTIIVSNVPTKCSCLVIWSIHQDLTEHSCCFFPLAREPRGFGFIQYVDPADAAEAKYQMDGQILLGRELTVVFAEENRKKPSDMRARERRYDEPNSWHCNFI